MSPKRFSLADAQAKGTLTKKARVDLVADAGPTLAAVARPWGSAFWAFEGTVLSKAITQFFTCLNFPSKMGVLPQNPFISLLLPWPCEMPRQQNVFGKYKSWALPRTVSHTSSSPM